MARNRKQFLFWLMLAIPYFKPAIFAEISWLAVLENLFNYWRLAAAGLLAVLYLRRVILDRRISPVMVGLGIYEAAIVLSTVTGSRNWFYVLNCAATMMSFCMLLELTVREDPLLALDVCIWPLTFQLTVNFILLTVFPYGILQGGKFGNAFNYMAIDNQLAAFVLPWIVLCCLRDTMCRGELRFLGYYAVVIGMLTELLVWSATGMVTIFLLIVYVLFFYLRRGEILGNHLTFLAGTFGMFFGIIVLRLQMILSGLVEGVLQKGLSFTGRTELWDTARDMFLEKPWLGWGLGLQGKVYRMRKGRYYPAHSVIYEILIQGGVLAMSGFLVMLVSAGQKLLEYRRHPYACLISAGLLCFGVVGSMESYIDNNAVLLFGLFFLAWRLPEIIEKRDIPPLPVLAEERG